MYTDRTSSAYWVAAIIVVLAVAAVAWWYTATSGTPLVPNTGASMDSGTTSSPLRYEAQ